MSRLDEGKMFMNESKILDDENDEYDVIDLIIPRASTTANVGKRK